MDSSVAGLELQRSHITTQAKKEGLALISATTRAENNFQMKLWTVFLVLFLLVGSKVGAIQCDEIPEARIIKEGSNTIAINKAGLRIPCDDGPPLPPTTQPPTTCPCDCVSRNSAESQCYGLGPHCWVQKKDCVADEWQCCC